MAIRPKGNGWITDVWVGSKRVRRIFPTEEMARRFQAELSELKTEARWGRSFGDFPKEFSPKNNPEKEIVRLGIEKLLNEGFRVWSEVGAKPGKWMFSGREDGRIDIVAERGEELRIIEAKASAKTNSITSAVGQLLYYRDRFPDASMWILCSEKPKKRVEDFARSFGIDFMDTK